MQNSENLFLFTNSNNRLKEYLQFKKIALYKTQKSVFLNPLKIILYLYALNRI